MQGGLLGPSLVPLYTVTAVLLFLSFIGCTFGRWLYAALLGNGIARLYSHQLTEM